MKIIQTRIPNVLILEPLVYEDERGYFMEVFRSSILGSRGINYNFVQENQSRSIKNVLRGIHYQIKQTQGKLVRVLVGEIFDVAVDLQKNSAFFGQWVGIRLSSENKKQIWIPPGFGHGFLVLSEYAEVCYKTTEYYAPEYERTLIWNDPTLKINWPLFDEDKPIISDKDLKGSALNEIELF